MSISYPLTFPTGHIVNISLKAQSTVAASSSPFTGQVQVQEYSARFWVADISLPPMLRASSEDWISFLLKLGGRRGTFLLGDPAGTTPRGVATGTPLVKGSGQSGIGYATDLITDGWTPSTTGILKAGDYIQIGTGSSARLLKNLTDVNSNVSGEATLTLWPFLPIISGVGVADNAPIYVNSCVGNFRLDTNISSFDIGEAGIYGINFSAVSVV